MVNLGLRRGCGSSHIWRVRYLQVVVHVFVVSMWMPTVLVAVPYSMTATGRMEEKGEHTQETELGVHVDSHCPLTTGPRDIFPPV